MKQKSDSVSERRRMPFRNYIIKRLDYMIRKKKTKRLEAAEMWFYGRKLSIRSVERGNSVVNKCEVERCS